MRHRDAPPTIILFQQSIVSSGIRAESTLGEGFNALTTDVPHLKRAIRNLVYKALDAIPDDGTSMSRYQTIRTL